MKTVDILIFSGQSNMQGQSERCSEREPVAHAWEYRYLTDTLIPLCNPVGENIRYDGTPGEDVTPATDIAAWLAEHVLGASCYGHTNLVPSFCRAYTKESGRQLIAVHAAKGSTCIAQWLPGTDGYRALVQKSCAAIACARREGYAIGGVYLVWLQGESDALMSTTMQSYADSLVALSDALQGEIGLDAFGIICVGRFARDERDNAIIEAQKQICRAHAGFLMLCEAAPTMHTNAAYMNPYVAGHYSAEGLEYLGKAAGEALARAGLTSRQECR